MSKTYFPYKLVTYDCFRDWSAASLQIHLQILQKVLNISILWNSQNRWNENRFVGLKNTHLHTLEPVFVSVYRSHCKLVIYCSCVTAKLPLESWFDKVWFGTTILRYIQLPCLPQYTYNTQFPLQMLSFGRHTNVWFQFQDIYSLSLHSPQNTTIGGEHITTRSISCL